ncbi:hypothetical protein FHL15_002659 [Xylaria flabelliformis]|uniref:Uncharacterized protein n=1 Tax=Xylaria flabelliformis TaxID=2512241 RepID=A0A553I861_9PEZI|nr:hypothetical protein FHL15_002659 [Xylaria flabelliformis]
MLLMSASGRSGDMGSAALAGYVTTGNRPLIETHEEQCRVRHQYACAEHRYYVIHVQQAGVQLFIHFG